MSGTPPNPPAHGEPPCEPDSAGISRYLAAILELGRDGRPVTLTAVAMQLGVSVPSAHEMVGRLARLGYVERKPLALTAHGTSTALVLKARRRAAQALVRDVLGMQGEQAEREGERLASTSSPEFGRRLSQWYVNEHRAGSTPDA